MNLGRLIEDVRERWGNSPAADLTIALAQKLSDRGMAHGRFLTFQSLAAAVGREELDAEVLQAIVALTGGSQPFLESHFLFVDADGGEVEVEPNDIAEARRIGYLVDPISGESLADFEEHIFPFFSLSGSVADGESH